MPICRAEHKRDFTMILNEVLNDTRLSYGARGLMAHALTHYDEWEFTGEEYFVNSKDKISKVKGYLKELIEHGYLYRSREKKDKGRLGNAIYIFREIPKCEKPMLENPMLENHILDKDKGKSAIEPKVKKPMLEKPTLDLPTLENRTPNNTNINNNNNIYSDFVKEFIKIYPGKKVKSVRDKKLPGLIQKYGVEQMKRCVQRYVEYVQAVRTTGVNGGNPFQLQFQNESRFWNSSYIDYLDENYEEVETSKEDPTDVANDFIKELYK